MLKTILLKISDFGITMVDRGGLVFCTFFAGLSALYWKGDEKNENYGWFFGFISEGWLIFIGAALLICAFLLSLNKQIREKSLTAIKTELASAEYKLEQVGSNIHDLFNGSMLNLSQRFGFTNSTKARLSLYINDADKNCFIPFGRYSPNPVLRRKGPVSYTHLTLPTKA